ncbi:MAG: alpha/beta hydrolase [Okeania sp. SIO3I5]|uniref:alpha/beta hydrolase n=1 Tax=Okeania sp. SIO3I5 TaxID=2607805 RepID=UPI0013B62B1F|nr:alpha/beta hydrolase [Okeania sp. SIO3I5]NEQ35018.1 alpha/beta hydrolase [Okeania sp. SIO3I5]
MKSILNLGASVKKLFQFSGLNKRLSKLFYISLAGILTIISSILIFTSQPANAIDEIKITYESINIPIAISDLEKFANTGEQSEQLKSLFLTANASEEDISRVREILSYKLEVKPDFVNKLLESRYGELAIEEFSRYFSPNSDVSQISKDIIDAINNIIADGEISFLELVQKFKWTDRIVIDAKGIETFFVQAIELAKRGLDFVREQPQVQKIVCQ